MFGRTKSEAMKENVVGAAELASTLARDKKFRKELLAAVGHGAVARHRTERRLGLRAALSRMNADPKLRRELRALGSSLDKAWARVEKKRSHRLRNSLIVLGLGGAAAAALLPKSRDRLVAPARGAGEPTVRTITESIEVDVPVSTAYNQWTQFEDFPLFMEGVEHVQQLDDTRLRWVAAVAGKRAEWEAKILEQHPDRQISWISADGKETRGTVSFEPRGDSRALVRLAMSYRPEGLRESLGSVARLDERRVRGDLKRFKELIESRGIETGAWRGDIAAGAKIG